MPPTLAIFVVIAAVLVGALVTTWFLVGAGRGRRMPAARPRYSLSITPHAQQRMVERDIAAAEILSVVAQPDRAVPTEYADFGAWGGPTRKDSVHLEGEIDGRILKVWVPAPWPASVREVVVKSAAWADFVATVRVPANAVGRVIGRGGATINGIQRDTGTAISNLGGGLFEITADDERAIPRARRAILTAAHTPARTTR